MGRRHKAKPRKTQVAVGKPAATTSMLEEIVVKSPSVYTHIRVRKETALFLRRQLGFNETYDESLARLLK